ncbi:uncharacterized protein V6R79_020296 [Siganus canaliculatus]
MLKSAGLEQGGGGGRRMLQARQEEEEAQQEEEVQLQEEEEQPLLSLSQSFGVGASGSMVWIQQQENEETTSLAVL